MRQNKNFKKVFHPEMLKQENNQIGYFHLHLSGKQLWSSKFSWRILVRHLKFSDLLQKNNKPPDKQKVFKQPNRKANCLVKPFYLLMKNIDRMMLFSCVTMVIVYKCTSHFCNGDTENLIFDQYRRRNPLVSKIVQNVPHVPSTNFAKHPFYLNIVQGAYSTHCSLHIFYCTDKENFF